MNLRFFGWKWIFKSALAVLVIVLAIMHFFPSDKAQVEKNTRSLLSVLNKKPGESLPVAASHSLKAVSYLASNVVLQLGEPFPRVIHKSEVSSLLQQLRMRASRLSVKSQGHHIIQKSSDEIWIDITVNAEIDIHQNHDQILGAYRLIWVKMNDGWKINRAETVEVIQHPHGRMIPY